MASSNSPPAGSHSAMKANINSPRTPSSSSSSNSSGSSESTLVATPASSVYARLTDDEIAAVQIQNLKDVVDFRKSADWVEQAVQNTLVTLPTYRIGVRYAHTRLKTQRETIDYLEGEFDKRSLSDGHRGVSRNVEAGVKEAQHLDDDDWLNNATFKEMKEEITIAAFERRAKEFSEVNMRRMLEDVDVLEQLKAQGRGPIPCPPEGHPDSFAAREHQKANKSKVRGITFHRGGGRAAIASAGTGRGHVTEGPGVNGYGAGDGSRAGFGGDMGSVRGRGEGFMNNHRGRGSHGANSWGRSRGRGRGI
ncbi:hypothetical protein BDY17DRAFT_46562 [Neohortaea acidophila]|uniref:Uncharacterized protein n=1 Tax=Neohortaea acidophila TaxID=245834 RepID=A0A6A6PG56_9PEZI|nr:uncharacterized protein BDY17DRAFT_46562 [Neohortaea acidophila]KAF2478960.1 hypothetical protein BDY17DRAFT_46562 [Neohortaea acidophila]